MESSDTSNLCSHAAEESMNRAQHARPALSYQSILHLVPGQSSLVTWLHLRTHHLWRTIKEVGLLSEGQVSNSMESTS